MSRVGFFISEAFRALRRSAAPSVAAIVTIATTTLLLGVLIPVLDASESKAQDVREQIGLSVYIYDDATPAEIESLRKDLEATPHVTGAEFISKKEAVEILRSREGTKEIVETGFSELRGNPLPRSFDISLDDPNNLRAVSGALQPSGASGGPEPINPIIQEVKESREKATEITEVTGAVKIVMFVLAVLLLVASLMLVANTIRLSIYARRREVEVMRLVGATNWFIRWPFVLEGIIVGLMGALIAVAILAVGKLIIIDPLADDFDLIANFSTVGFLPLVTALMGAAVLVSALGSGITLRRFLQV